MYQKVSLSGMVLLLLGCFSSALEITGDTKIDAAKLGRLTASKVPDGAAVLWTYPDSLDAEEAGEKLLFTGPPGAYRVSAMALSLTKDGKTVVERAKILIIIGTPVPPPPPPPPPGPPVPPTPPTPPAPIPVGQLRVIILYDKTGVAKLPAAQRAILFSSTLREYLNKKCPPDAKSGTNQWRVVDPQDDLSGDQQIWQDVLKRQRASLPWIVVSNGKTGFEGPLPGSITDTLTLLQKYGGA